MAVRHVSLLPCRCALALLAVTPATPVRAGSFALLVRRAPDVDADVGCADGTAAVDERFRTRAQTNPGSVFDVTEWPHGKRVLVWRLLRNPGRSRTTMIVATEAKLLCLTLPRTDNHTPRTFRRVRGHALLYRYAACCSRRASRSRVCRELRTGSICPNCERATVGVHRHRSRRPAWYSDPGKRRMDRARCRR